MRPLWTGTISFGLVTIPVKLVSATEDRSVRFNQLRASDHSRVGYQRVAKGTDEPVDYDDIVKGYEYAPGEWVVFSKDELEALKPESSRTVEIQQFVPLEQIDPIYFARSYYVMPDERGAKAYGLLARAMQAQGTVAVCTITLRETEHLATLRLSDGVLVLATMLWPDEVKPIDHGQLGTDDLPEPRPQEVTMAEQLIDSLTEDFDPSAFTDTYRERILEAAEAKYEGREVVTAAEQTEPAPVLDLMQALRDSMRRSEGDEPADGGDDRGAGEAGDTHSAGAGRDGSGTAAKKAAKKSAKKAAKKSAKKSAGKATKKSAQKKATGKKATSGRSQRKAS